MSISRRFLCVFYTAIALFALVGTWRNNLQLVDVGSPLAAGIAFVQGSFVNPSSRSLTVDLLCLALPVITWMVFEAKRLNIRFMWLYVVFGLTIAISVTVPLFLIQRERVLARVNGEKSSGVLNVGDIVGLLLMTLLAFGYTVAACL